MGVWIEIVDVMTLEGNNKVTPFMGVWIEIVELQYQLTSHPSHPLWVCGLKFFRQSNHSMLWRHTLYGCVD